RLTAAAGRRPRHADPGLVGLETDRVRAPSGGSPSQCTADDLPHRRRHGCRNPRPHRRPGPMSGPVDAGLQAERTALAWRRTCLALLAGSLVATRILPEFFGAWSALLGVTGA